MKLTPLFLLVSLFSVASVAQEEAPMVDGIADDQVVQSVEFTGKSGVKATAAIVKMGEESPASLVIIHNKPDDIRNYLVIDNENLGLTVDGMAGTNSILEVAANGSLLIQQMNESIGRSRWSRTLTVAYRNGQYVVAGYTYLSRDTIDLDNYDSCDYNLLNGKGVRNGKTVSVSTKAIDLESLADTEELYSCDGW